MPDDICDLRCDAQFCVKPIPPLILRTIALLGSFSFTLDAGGQHSCIDRSCWLVKHARSLSRASLPHKLPCFTSTTLMVACKPFVTSHASDEVSMG